MQMKIQLQYQFTAKMFKDVIRSNFVVLYCAIVDSAEIRSWRTAKT